LLGKREFTKPQKRYLKCRLSKKVNDFVNNELLLLQKKGYLLLPLSSVAASCNGDSDNGSSIAACCNAELTNSNKNGAGSGNFVPPSPHPQRGREGNISNPRVLSDMGLAIPRPTRLGDPRIFSGSLEIIISLLPHVRKDTWVLLTVAPQQPRRRGLTTLTFC
jgi:hypothetical protein